MDNKVKYVRLFVILLPCQINACVWVATVSVSNILHSWSFPLLTYTEFTYLYYLICWLFCSRLLFQEALWEQSDDFTGINFCQKLSSDAVVSAYDHYGMYKTIWFIFFIPIIDFVEDKCSKQQNVRVTLMYYHLLIISDTFKKTLSN